MDALAPRRSCHRRPALATVALAFAVCAAPAPAGAEPVEIAGQTVIDGAAKDGGACPAAGHWLDPRSGEIRRADRVLAEAAADPVVLLGETHDQEDHHRWQLHTIAGLHALRPDMVLGFEMFPRRTQPVLDRWVRGELDEDAFLKAVDWEGVWGFDASFYLPMFHFARLHKVPMIALNVDRGLVSQVAAEGWDAVAEADREGIGTPAAATDAYRLGLAQVFAEKARRHAEAPREAGAPTALEEDEVDMEVEAEADRAAAPGHAQPGSADGFPVDAVLASPGFVRFVEAQLTWDRAMAEGLARAAETAPAPLVVGVIGSGHLEHDWGVPHQLSDLGIGDAAVLLPWPPEQCAEMTADVADAVFLLTPGTPKDETQRPRLGIMVAADPDGVRVVSVDADSVAEAAGLIAGDVIVSAAGSPTRRVDELSALVRAQQPGADVPLVIIRDGETRRLTARFGDSEAASEEEERQR